MKVYHHNILSTYSEHNEYIQEFFWQEHSLSIILSGESHVFQEEEPTVATAGRVGLIRKNQIFKSLKKNAPDGTPYHSMCILLNQEILRKYSAENELYAVGPYRGGGYVNLSNDPFLKGLFDSLLPYLSRPTQLTKGLAELKTREAIALLLAHDFRLKEFLFDFSEPYKIDLEAFMLGHFTYNISLEEFARMSGRSLSTFKRDFKKLYNQAPAGWLKEMRLNKAHYLIAEKRKSPTEIYYLAGFENFSHFSASFKEQFGYAPSSLKNGL